VVTDVAAVPDSMPISATGKATVKQPASVSAPSLPAPLNVLSQRGFTLLEIMLVLAVMAVVAGFVLPNLFRPSTASLDDTSRHLVRLLHLASEEAQLRGMQLRWKAYDDHYAFELTGGGGEWQALNEPPFTNQKLPDGVTISEVKRSEGVQFFMPSVTDARANAADAQQSSVDGSADKRRQSEKEKVPLGTVVFMSDGMLTLADVKLHTVAGDARIELRPGPAGIRVLDNTP